MALDGLFCPGIFVLRLSFGPAQDVVSGTADFGREASLGCAVPRNRLHFFLLFAKAEEAFNAVVAVFGRELLRIVVPKRFNGFLFVHFFYLARSWAGVLLLQNWRAGLFSKRDNSTLEGSSKISVQYLTPRG